MSKSATALLAAAVAGGAGLVSMPVARAQEMPDSLHVFLQQEMSFTAEDFQALRAGQAVVTAPTAANPREIGAFGVVRVNAPSRALADTWLDIEGYMRSDAVLQSGRFSSPPTTADLAGLTLPEGDLEALRACRLGDCGLKLSAGMLDRLRREVHWAAPGWRAEATACFKQLLVDYVAAYLRDGDAALAEYVDKAPAVKLAEETRALVAESPYLKNQAPEFLRHLGPAPSSMPPLPGASRVIYWAKEQFGFKPTITVSEVTIYLPPGGPAAPIFVAASQVYATHYFEASVALTVATAVGGSPSPPAFHMLYLHRSRLDSLRGGFAGLKRFTAGRRLRHRLEEILRQSKAHIERQAVLR
jgi:hypothetical protein